MVTDDASAWQVAGASFEPLWRWRCPGLLLSGKRCKMGIIRENQGELVRLAVLHWNEWHGPTEGQGDLLEELSHRQLSSVPDTGHPTQGPTSREAPS